MQKLVLALGLMLALKPLSSRAQWLNQPVPQLAPTEIVFQISALDATTAWATTLDTDSSPGHSRRVVRTTNGGTTWSALPVSGLSATDYVTSVCGLSASTAWVSVASEFAPAGGKLLRTTDGGQTWTAATGVFVSTGSLPRQVRFFDANNGIAVGEAINSAASAPFEILTTTNGGATWQQTLAGSIPARIPAESLTSPWPTLRVLGTRAWFATDEGRVYRSSDRGLTWSVSSSGLTDYINNLAFRDASNGLATTEDGTAASTANGGLTWTPLAPNGPLHAVSVVAVPGTRTYVSVGLQGEPGGAGSSYSTNDGQTWTAIESTIDHALVDFASPTAGWSGGLTLLPTSTRGNGINKYTGLALSTHARLAQRWGLEAYPNPSADGRFSLRAPQLRTAATFRVLDPMGRVVLEQAWQASALAPLVVDLSRQAAGVYVLELATPEGPVRHTLVVE